MPLFLQSTLGVFVFIGLAWAVSEDRRAFPWRIVLAGLAFQFVLAAVLFSAPSPGELDATHMARSSMDAITSGTIAGVALLMIVFVALVSLADTILSLLPHFGGEPVTLRHILGVLMAPLVWLAGIPWGEAQAAGALMGTKTVLNELVAYLDLARLPKGELSERSVVIMTYALCGFANFGSLGI